jgi:hypothetical protein
VRKGVEAKLRTAVRHSAHWNPDFARLVSQVERGGLPIDRVLSGVVSDSSHAVELRGLAARLLRDVGGDTCAFCPLLAEFIAAGDEKTLELRRVIQAMWGRLARPEFEILQEVLRGGTDQQRYWVVNEISFCKGHRVRRALIEVLADTTSPAFVRGWAAERLNMHISQKTVEACLRAIEDASPDVRLWAVFTLGDAASQRPVFRAAVIPILERMMADDGVAPGWWAVRREAQVWLASLRGGSDNENRLQAEIRAILNDPAASVEDKNWAGLYGIS